MQHGHVNVKLEVYLSEYDISNPIYVQCNCNVRRTLLFHIFSIVHHSIELFYQQTLMHNFLY